MNSRVISASVAGCLLFVACGGDDGDASTTSSTTEVAASTPVATDAPTTEPAVTTPPTTPMVFEGATIVVANGNIAAGSAGRMTDALATAGFTTAAPTNATEKIDESIVYYTDAEGAQAVAETLGVKLGGVDVLPLPDPIPTETGTLDAAAVLLVLGNNQADKSLDELSGAGAVDAVVSTTVVVANANTIGGSAGRMSSQLESAGYPVGTPVDALETRTESIIYYTDADGAQADADTLATALGGVEVAPMPDPIPVEGGSIDGDILLLLGSSQADKPLSELAG